MHLIYDFNRVEYLLLSLGVCFSIDVLSWLSIILTPFPLSLYVRICFKEKGKLKDVFASKLGLMNIYMSLLLGLMQCVYLACFNWGWMSIQNIVFELAFASLNYIVNKRLLISRVYSLLSTFLILRASKRVGKVWAGWKLNCCFQPRAAPWV